MNTSAEQAIYDDLVARVCIYQSGQNGLPEVQFQGISGDHLEGYANLDPILALVRYSRNLIGSAVEPWIVGSTKPDTTRIGAVVTAATGSIPLATLAADIIMEAENRDNVIAPWADKIKGEDGSTDFHFHRTRFPEQISEVVSSGMGILVVEDMINRRHSVLRVMAALRHIVGDNAPITGVTTIAANSDVNAENLGVPTFKRLCEVSYETWTPEACPVGGPCSRSIPMVIDEALGHGAEFREKNPDYTGGFISLLERR